MLVISGESINLGRKEFIAIDHASGGYPYWSSRLFSAKEFNNIEDALKFLDDSEFTRVQKMNDGVIYPPRMLSGVKMESVKIEEINLVEVEAVDFSSVITEYKERKTKADKLIEELKTL